MDKIIWVLIALLQVTLYLCPVCFSCIVFSGHSGSLSDETGSTYDTKTYCRIIKVPKDRYVRLDINETSFTSRVGSRGGCSKAYIKIIVPAVNQTYIFCSPSKLPILALSDTYIHYYHTGSDDWYRKSSFSLHFKTESLACAQSNHFRCSDDSCIHQDKVCDRVLDCENGADEKICKQFVDAFEGVETSRNDAVTWLKKQRSVYGGWGKNTPRAISALYLAGAISFRGKDSLEEEVISKQLEVQTAVGLLRNSTEPLSVSELSMFVNALTATCHNPRRFYGFDLVQTLSDRVSTYNKPCPGAYLTLCNLNWTFSHSDVLRLLNLLENQSEHPFLLDIQAMTVMAVSCMKKKMANFETIANASDIYNSTIQRFIAGQLPDGSFGNVYTTALITQALIANGEESNLDWKINSTAQYLIQQLDPISKDSTSESVDFLSVYLILPTLRHSSLANIEMVDCVNTSRKQRDYKFQAENQISDILEKLEKKVRIQYSLFVGDLKDVIHTIHVTVPLSSTVYDVMRMAQVTDPKYKLQHRDMSGRMYIYDIGGITNDPEEGKFWLLYTTSIRNMSRNLVLHTESPEKLVLRDADHVVMWYKTASV